MTTPEAHAALAAALAKVQAELPEVKKTRTAKVEKDGRLLYTYDYADLADVSIAILPILGKHGLAFMAVPGHQPDGKFGLRYYLLHSGGGQVEGFYEIPEQGGIQVVGGRITYARRYCLCAVTGVAAEEDVDARDDAPAARATAQRRQRPASQAPAEPQQAARRAPRQQPAEGLPPLPDEEEETSSGPAPQGQPAGNEPAAGPDDTDYDTPGTAVIPQITAIWTVLSTVYQFGRDEKDQARMVCAQIIGRELESTKNLSRNEAKAILDALGHWRAQAEAKGDDTRAYLIQMLAMAEEARHGE